MAHTMTLEDAVEKFLREGAAYRAYADLTVESYGRSLRRFLGFASDLGISRPAQVTLPVLIRYVSGLNGTGAHQGAASIRNKIAAVGALWSFLIDLGEAEESPLRRLKLPKLHPTPQRFLSPEEAHRLLAACETPMEQDAIALFLNTGIRRMELTLIEVTDVDVGREYLDVRGKGARPRRIHLNPDALAAVERQMQSRNGTGSRYLFTTNGNQVPLRAVNQMVSRVAKRAGLEGVTPHALRRTCATATHHAGGSARTVQQILGHSSIVTTEKYLDSTEEMMTTALDRIAY